MLSPTGCNDSEPTVASPDEPQAARPVTYSDAEDSYRGTVGARERFEELDHRHHMVRAEEALKARREYDSAKYGPEGQYEPLTVADRLELIATGEVLARYYRHPVQVHYALEAGATWAQVAAARGTGEAQARQDYREWADRSHALWERYEGKFGMDPAEHAAAMRKAAEPGREAGQ
jgi:hypothetical protein